MVALERAYCAVCPINYFESNPFDDIINNVEPKNINCKY